MALENVSTRLRQVGEERVVPLPQKEKTLDQAALEMILLGLKTLSQRTIVAFAQLFSTLTCFSVFWLFYTVLPSPTVNQLVGLFLYGIFVLALHLVRKKS